jgi:hypothetical protein
MTLASMLVMNAGKVGQFGWKSLQPPAIQHIASWNADEQQKWAECCPGRDQHTLGDAAAPWYHQTGRSAVEIEIWAGSWCTERLDGGWVVRTDGIGRLPTLG